MVAKDAGANVVLSELNPYRLELAQSLGYNAVNPKETDLVQHVMNLTNGAGADVAFEVSSSAAGAKVITDLLRTRGLAVIVGIFGQPPQIDLFRFFWRELRMKGVRVYEPQDYERAIELVPSGRLPVDKLITNIQPLETLKSGFEEMESGGNVMKILLEV